MGDTTDALRKRLQQQCVDWDAYWREPDAHGVILSPEQATELLADALGVEVEITATPAGSASGEAPFAVVGGVEFDSPQALCAAHADLQAEVARLREDAARPKPAEHFGMAIIADDTLHPGEIAFICRGKRTVFSIDTAIQGSANGQG